MTPLSKLRSIADACQDEDLLTLRCRLENHLNILNQFVFGRKLSRHSLETLNVGDTTSPPLDFEAVLEVATNIKCIKLLDGAAQTLNSGDPSTN